MRFCILSGSPRKKSNTDALVSPFVERLTALGAETETLYLRDLSIAPCRGCYACQDVSGRYGCAQSDGMERIVSAIIRADCLVLACPIYTWYCPGDMKNVLDRFFGMNKFYRSGTGSLWAGKSVALILSHGYEAHYACDPFENGIVRLCEHSHLRYLGLYSVRDEDDMASFITPEAQSGARAFADQLYNAF